MKHLLTRLYSRCAQRKVSLLACGAAFGLGVAILLPANGSAAPIGMRFDSEAQSLLFNSQEGQFTLVHCCHSHPYHPYDSYCCHPPGAYVGTAVVGGAIAYGTYRGVKSAHKHHHKHHHNKPKPRRHKR